MPPARVATTTRDQSSAQSRKLKTTKRAASVPPGQREDSKLELLRLKKQKPSLLHIEDTLPSSSPDVTARGRKRDRDSSARAPSQANDMASTSASAAGPTADASEQRPQKRRKRSSSTPAPPRLSQRLLSRRRSQSRVGSPMTDVECVLPPQGSARRLHKFHPLPNGRVDIYTHLAVLDGAGSLLNEPPASSPIPNETIASQSSMMTRGRRRKNADLADENAKTHLMEEWAHMRRSQGSLSLSGIDGNTCSSQTFLRENGKDDGPALSMQLDLIPGRRSPDADLLTSQTTTAINISQSQETTLGDSLQGPSPPRMEFGSAFPVDTDVTGKKPDHQDSGPPFDDGTEQPIVPIPVITPILGSHTDGIGEPADDLEPAHDPDSLQRPGSRPPSPPCSRVVPVHSNHTNPTEFSITEQVTSLGADKDNRSATLPQTYTLDVDRIHLDSDEEFYMLEIPEVFTLPWVPVSSHLYVPPSVGRLISGMKEQLIIEARARRRAEELYHAELSRRVSAEKTIDDLRAALEDKQGDLTTQPSCSHGNTVNKWLVPQTNVM